MRAFPVAMLRNLAVLLLLSPILHAQASQSALRFFGTGANQQDRLLIRVDDDAPGADASTPCDVGAGSFTIELWVKGTHADNPTGSSGAQGSYADARWINGNMLVDRDIESASEREFGISLAGGRVRFGTGRGDPPAQDAKNTLEGDVDVLDGAWHHVACVRDASTGKKRILVDGVLDIESPAGVSAANLSYPNNGVAGQPTPWGPYLVIGAEKYDAGPASPAFRGRVDELRIWNLARSRGEIGASFERLVPAATPGLVGWYRFEEGAGTDANDSSAAGSPAGALTSGSSGNGEWSSFSQSTSNTAPVTSSVLPVGFVRSTIASSFSAPTTMEFTPDGRLFVGERNGTIRIVQNDVLLPTPLVQLPADTQTGERGLLCMAVDPAFASNGWLYTYWSSPEPRDTISRWTVVGNTLSLASEYVVWQNQQLSSVRHHGGAIAFGPDGKLYLSIGDQFVSANAQDLTVDPGKLLRMNADGTVPPDNPFLSVPGARPLIYALGLRNPWRISFDALTGALWIGDVGANVSESWEEVERGVAGLNYGWPNQEGDACYTANCSGYRQPEYTYRQDNPLYHNGTVQASVTLGEVYRATQFPLAYRGNLFIGDFANGWIRRLVFDGAGNLVGEPLFASANSAGTIVDLEIGPEGSLWYLAYGVGWSGPQETPALYRIAWTGGVDLPPVAIAFASPSSGPAPLSVQFQGSASYDPDAGPASLTYAWTFGDGATSTLVNPQHVYASAGPYQASLTVSDSLIQSAPAPITILCGHPPVATISTPLPGTTYHAGDTINFSGSANDVDDGPLPPSALTWEVLLVHQAHAHPFFGPVSGTTSGSFTVPTSGHGPANTHYQIRLRATDSTNLPTTAVRDVYPVVSNLSIASVPARIPIFLDGDPLSTPAAYPSVVGFVHTLSAWPSWTRGERTYLFERWSNGSTSLDTTFTAPAGGGSFAAYYKLEAPTSFRFSVEAVDRNAEHYPPNGQTSGHVSNANEVCAGRNTGGAYQMGFEFALAIPRGTPILSARLELASSGDNSGNPSTQIRAYAIGNAPPFLLNHNPTVLTAFAPLVPISLGWSPPALPAGVLLTSPNLAPLLPAIVDRADWNPGNFAGFVIDGTPTSGPAWRCVRNFNAGSPARLLVTYGSAQGGGQVGGLR